MALKIFVSMWTGWLSAAVIVQALNVLADFPQRNRWLCMIDVAVSIFMLWAVPTERARASEETLNHLRKGTEAFNVRLY